MGAFAEPHFSAYQSWGASGGNKTVVDMVMPDMLHLVDSYWYQFPPMNPLWHSILGCYIILVGTIGTIGNFVVINVFTSTKSLKTPSNLLVCNLAFSDMMMFVCMAPPMALSCFRETWEFGPFACEMYAFAGSLFGCTSIYTMMAIAFDRYNVIVKGLAGKPMTNNGALIRIVGIWVWCLLWTIFPMVGWGRYVPEGNMTACGTDYLSQDLISRSYVFVYAIFVYFIPLFTIIYSYYFILSAVSAHEKNMRDQAKKMNVASLRSAENQAQSAECKLAKVALMTISLWFMAWTPYLIVNFAGIFQMAPITPLTTIWGSVFAKTNAVYNPIVYGISHPKYRAALHAKYPSLACNGDQQVAVAGGDNESVATGVSEEKA